MTSATSDAVAEMRDLAIIDAHHHFWDLSMNAHPWLCREPMIPFRYGDYSAIRRDFLPSDYDAAASSHRVIATVTMEGEWDEANPVAESRWINELRSETGRPAAHVARAFLDRSDADEVLAGHAAFDFVRGIRHKPTAAATPDTIEPGAPGAMSDPNWRAGYARLARHGLHFELQAPWWHIGELEDLVAAYPETAVVINHAFMPVDRTDDGLAAWADALKRAAGLANTTLKISGIGIRGVPWRYADQECVIKTCIDTFGPSRCMFASNFPVDGVCGSFETIFDGYKQAVISLPQADRDTLFSGTAARVYGLENLLTH
jgi:predicted TIM-barrel fold metal-dependent hydrolase